MNRANRAAQFQPFDALKGLHEALRAKEEKLNCEQKRYVSEELQTELSNMLIKAERGMIIEVTFYYYGHYIITKGKLIDKNEPFKYIVVDKTKICFDDIYTINIIYDD